MRYLVCLKKNLRTRISECLTERRSTIRFQANVESARECGRARRVEKRNTGPAMVSMVTHTVDFPGKRLIQYSFGRRARRIYMQTYNACLAKRRAEVTNKRGSDLLGGKLDVS